MISNRYHLIIGTPDRKLSKGMRQVNGVYALRLDRRHKREGHIFQGRYKAIIMKKIAYLLELARYLVLCAVRARILSSTRHWP